MKKELNIKAIFAIFILSGFIATYAAVDVILTEDAEAYLGIDDGQLKSPAIGRPNLVDAQLDVCLGRKRVNSLKTLEFCESECNQRISESCSLSLCKSICSAKYFNN